MSWVDADARFIGINNSIILVVDAQKLDPRLDYPSIVERGMEQFHVDGGRLGDTLFVIATPMGKERLIQIAQSADLLGPAALAKAAEEVVQDKDAVVLRWQI